MCQPLSRIGALRAGTTSALAFSEELRVEAQMFDRFKILPQIWRTGRLALRLLRDSRVPMAAKFIFGATVLYMVSPLDVVPDWLPVIGQADDLMVLLAGLNLFLRSCPKWLVNEHEDAIDGRPTAEFGEPRPERRDAGTTIDGQYRRVV
jgi:uncharacterized membrane protein YkvA (DUF1232 family)